MTPARRFEIGYKCKKQNTLMGSGSDKRLKFKKGKQRELVERLIQEFGSQRKLAEFIGVSKTTIRDYANERSNIPKSYFLKIIDNFPIYVYSNEFIENELPWNWGRIKGGKNRVSNIKNIHNYLKYVRSFNNKNEQIKKCSAIRVENIILERLKKDNVDLMAILAICLMADLEIEKVNAPGRI